MNNQLTQLIAMSDSTVISIETAVVTTMPDGDVDSTMSSSTSSSSSIMDGHDARVQSGFKSMVKPAKIHIAKKNVTQSKSRPRTESLPPIMLSKINLSSKSTPESHSSQNTSTKSTSNSSRKPDHSPMAFDTFLAIRRQLNTIANTESTLEQLLNTMGDQLTRMDKRLTILEQGLKALLEKPKAQKTIIVVITEKTLGLLSEGSTKEDETTST